jgi:hypothetical protein
VPPRWTSEWYVVVIVLFVCYVGLYSVGSGGLRRFIDQDNSISTALPFIYDDLQLTLRDTLEFRRRLPTSTWRSAAAPTSSPPLNFRTRTHRYVISMRGIICYVVRAFRRCVTASGCVSWDKPS